MTARLTGWVASIDKAIRKLEERWRADSGTAADLAEIREYLAKPIPMILFCPECGFQHIDEPNESTTWANNDHPPATAGEPWTNPPHRSHLCEQCGHIWRPADVATEGVREIRTKGTADNLAYRMVDGTARKLSITTAERDEARRKVFSLQRWFDERGDIIRSYREGIKLGEVFGYADVRKIEGEGYSLTVEFGTMGARDEFMQKLTDTVVKVDK